MAHGVWLLSSVTLQTCKVWNALHLNSTQHRLLQDCSRNRSEKLMPSTTAVDRNAFFECGVWRTALSPSKTAAVPEQKYVLQVLKFELRLLPRAKAERHAPGGNPTRPPNKIGTEARPHVPSNFSMAVDGCKSSPLSRTWSKALPLYALFGGTRHFFVTSKTTSRVSGFD